MDDVLTALRSPAGLADPYPIYDDLRARDPVHRTPTGAYLLTRYADCAQVLQDHETFHSPGPDVWKQLYPRVDEHPSLQELLHRNMLALRPPLHTRLRTHLGRGLTPNRVRAMRDAVRRLCAEAVGELRDRLHGGAVADLHTTLSVPLPMRVAATLVGVPESDHAWYAKVLPDVLRCSDPAATEDDLRVSDQAVTEMRGYLMELIAARRAAPGPDLISGLLETGLAEDEQVLLSLGLLRGGFETTAAAIDNGVFVLLGDANLVELLRADPRRTPGFAQEVLRHSSPVQCNPGVRLAAHEVEIGGVPIPRGADVRTLIGAANRDPEVYPAPAEFRLGRLGPAPLTFGTGIHFCPASGLARMQLAEVFAQLVAELPGLILAGRPVRRPTVVLRAFDELLVRSR